MKELKTGDGLLPPDLSALAIPGRILELSLAAKIPAVFPTALWIQQGAKKLIFAINKGTATVMDIKVPVVE